MKSQGLQLVGSQMASADRLVKLAAVATKAACIDIQLTQSCGGIDQLPASNVFTEPEIQTLAVPHRHALYDRLARNLLTTICQAATICYCL